MHDPAVDGRRKKEGRKEGRKDGSYRVVVVAAAAIELTEGRNAGWKWWL